MKFGIFLILFGLGMGWQAYEEACVSFQSTEDPEAISLQQLLARGPVGNAHLILTGFVPCGNYVYQQTDRNSVWNKVWIPLVPIQKADANDRRPPNPTAPKVLLVSRNVGNSLDLERQINRPRLRVAVLTSVTSRDVLVPAQTLLRDAYPGIDLQTCLILEEGRILKSPTQVYAMRGFAVGCLAIGVALTGFAFWRRKNQSNPLPTSPQADTSAVSETGPVRP